MGGLEKKVYGYVPEKIFYDMINEAKRADIFTDANKRVDIGALVAELATAFSEGRYPAIKERINTRKEKAKAEFSYLEMHYLAPTEQPIEEMPSEEQLANLEVTLVPTEKPKRSHKKKVDVPE